MIRGIYAAGSGLINRSEFINTISNNLVNAQTAGFKKDSLETGSFGDHLAERLSAESGREGIGSMVYGSVARDVYTSMDQGSFDTTDRSLDLAVSGNGFFTLQRADGTVSLTRNGQFMVNDQGYLASAQGALVLGQNGPIQVGTSDFTVGADGTIAVNGNRVDTLAIRCPADTTGMVKISDTEFKDPGNGNLPFTGRVRQGEIERSNVDVTQEMADLIEGSRSYQSCSQILKMMDQILQKTVNEVGRV